MRAMEETCPSLKFFLLGRRDGDVAALYIMKFPRVEHTAHYNNGTIFLNFLKIRSNSTAKGFGLGVRNHRYYGGKGKPM